MTAPENPDGPSPGDEIRRLVEANEAELEALFGRHGLSREESGEILFEVLVRFGVRREVVSEPRRWLLREVEHQCERRLPGREARVRARSDRADGEPGGDRRDERGEARDGEDRG